MNQILPAQEEIIFLWSFLFPFFLSKRVQKGYQPPGLPGLAWWLLLSRTARGVLCSAGSAGLCDSDTKMLLNLIWFGFFFSLEYPAQCYRGLCTFCSHPATQQDMQLLRLVLYGNMCEYQKRDCKFCTKTVCYSAKHLHYSAICQWRWWVTYKGAHLPLSQPVPKKSPNKGMTGMWQRGLVGTD